MHERLVQIPTPSGLMDTFVTHPEQDGPFPAVIIYMDIWGVREELFEIARRVGTVGYYCMVPDLYYRQGKVRHEFRDADNRMISLHALDEAGRAGAPGRGRLDRLLHGRASRAVRRRPFSRAHAGGGQPARHHLDQRRAGLAASPGQGVPRRALLRLRRDGSVRAAVDGEGARG